MKQAPVFVGLRRAGVVVAQAPCSLHAGGLRRGCCDGQVAFDFIRVDSVLSRAMATLEGGDEEVGAKTCV